MSRSKRILIVEDDEDILKLEEKHLQSAGHLVFTALNPLRAFEIILKEEPFDILITDVMMPGLDGYKFIKMLRSEPEYKKKCGDMPILILSAKTSEEDIASGLDLGALIYMQKPFSKDELMIAVNTIIDEYLLENEVKDLFDN